jgi:succinate dehydrogenase / fumarate reductase cytochrome b subunit
MAQNPNRPLSPHLGIYQKGAHMMASITHRITGFVIATVGMLTLLWWIASIAGGAESYASFQTWTIDAGKEATGWQTASNWFFRFVAVGVLWSFFQHFFSGIRHLLMDLGAGYELKNQPHMGNRDLHRIHHRHRAGAALCRKPHDGSLRHG